MKKLVKWLARKVAAKESEQQELESRIQCLLKEYGDCRETVVIASPANGSHGYSCVVTIPAVSLYIWAKEHVKGVYSFDIHSQASREFLPRWLEAANFKDGQISKLPPPIFSVVAPYVRQFVEQGAAQIFCIDCQSDVQNIQIHESGIPSDSVNTVWLESWTCPDNHVLYEKTHETRLFGPLRGTGL